MMACMACDAEQPVRLVSRTSGVAGHWRLPACDACDAADLDAMGVRCVHGREAELDEVLRVYWACRPCRARRIAAGGSTAVTRTARSRGGGTRSKRRRACARGRRWGGGGRRGGGGDDGRNRDGGGGGLGGGHRSGSGHGGGRGGRSGEISWQAAGGLLCGRGWQEAADVDAALLCVRRARAQDTLSAVPTRCARRILLSASCQTPGSKSG